VGDASQSLKREQFEDRANEVAKFANVVVARNSVFQWRRAYNSEKSADRTG
jgi:hypothetical protein